MKKLIIILSLLLAGTIWANAAYSQKVYNFDTVSTKNQKTKEQVIGDATLTKDMAIYKAISYPVYVSRNDKLFFVVQSKSGNWYKKYIKE